MGCHGVNDKRRVKGLRQWLLGNCDSRVFVWTKNDSLHKRLSVCQLLSPLKGCDCIAEGHVPDLAGAVLHSVQGWCDTCWLCNAV